VREKILAILQPAQGATVLRKGRCRLRPGGLSKTGEPCATVADAGAASGIGHDFRQVAPKNRSTSRTQYVDPIESRSSLKS
jgi:hypothetical protein